MQLLGMQGGKWEARLGQSKTRRHSYLGLFDSEEEAAQAYDTATIDRFGHGMAINFDLGQVGYGALRLACLVCALHKACDLMLQIRTLSCEWCSGGCHAHCAAS